jgi:hypothetical protein
MTINVCGAAGEMEFTHTSWGYLLQLAEEYDWEPYGTLPPRIGRLTDPHIPEEAWEYEEHPEWGGGYHSNDFQSVTDEDAANLVAALERALPDISDEDLMAAYETTTPEVAALGLRAFPSDLEVDPREWFSGPSKHKVQRFIEFCKAGGFTIS